MRGISLTELKDCTLTELAILSEESSRLEMEREKSEWERSRWMCAVLLAPYSGKGKTIKPKDLTVFPWEKGEDTKADPEREKRLKEIGDRWDAEMKKRYGIEEHH